MEREKLDKPGPSSRKRNRPDWALAYDKSGEEGMSPRQERRNSDRVSRIRVCLYEIADLSSNETFEVSEGRALTLNMSSGGLLLKLPQPVGERQVFEIKAPSLADEIRTTKLVEVRWTRPLRVNVHTTMHLAGVKLLFEPPSD